MTLASEMAADMAEIIADMPSVMVFNGVSHSVTVSPLTREDATETSGVFLNYDLQVVCTLSEFTTIPEPRTVVYLTDATLGLDSMKCFVQNHTIDVAALTLMVKRGKV